jgi:hypothetical protein
MTTSVFTQHEWDLRAGCARSRASLASQDAKRNDNPQVRSSFECEERAYRDPAAKCERLAKEPPAQGVLELPVLRSD